jgi:hypothetical protein
MYSPKLAGKIQPSDDWRVAGSAFARAGEAPTERGIQQKRVGFRPCLKCRVKFLAPLGALAFFASISVCPISTVSAQGFACLVRCRVARVVLSNGLLTTP